MSHGVICGCSDCLARASRSIGCTCPDCLAHRDPDDYGAIAQLVDVVSALRSSVVELLEAVDEPSNLLRDEDEDGHSSVYFALPAGARARARKAVAASRRWDDE